MLIEAPQLLAWGSVILLSVLGAFGRLMVWVIRRELSKLDYLVQENAEIKSRLRLVESRVGVDSRARIRRGGVA